VHALAAELVRPLSHLRAVILQASANPDEVAVFLFDRGRLRGPAAFSTLGMRIQNEQSGSTSLFAQPLAIEAIPEATEVRDQRAGNRKAGKRDQGTGNRSRRERCAGSTSRSSRAANAGPAQARARSSRIPSRRSSRFSRRKHDRAHSHNSAGPFGAAQALVLPP
jgi:hypothetical protein